MLTLCINTATKLSSFCLYDDLKFLGSFEFETNRNESDLLLPSIKSLFKASDGNGFSVSDIKRILVVKGPGSFTSLRVGIVTANTLAQNLGAELYALSTFELLRLMHGDNEPDFVTLPAGGKSYYILRRGEAEPSIVALEDSGATAPLLNFSSICVKILADPNLLKSFRVEKLPLLPYYVKDPAITL